METTLAQPRSGAEAAVAAWELQAQLVPIIMLFSVPFPTFALYTTQRR